MQWYDTVSAEICIQRDGQLKAELGPSGLRYQGEPCQRRTSVVNSYKCVDEGESRLVGKRMGNHPKLAELIVGLTGSGPLPNAIYIIIDRCYYCNGRTFIFDRFLSSCQSFHCYFYDLKAYRVILHNAYNRCLIPAGASSRFPYRRTYQHIRSRRRRCSNGLHLFMHWIKQ